MTHCSWQLTLGFRNLLDNASCLLLKILHSHHFAVPSATQRQVPVPAMRFRTLRQTFEIDVAPLLTLSRSLASASPLDLRALDVKLEMTASKVWERWYGVESHPEGKFYNCTVKLCSHTYSHFLG